MTDQDAILQNPFCILGASPADDRRKLTALAGDAALLGENGAEDALNTLLHPQRRLAAEVRWFPGTGQNEVEAVMRYLRSHEPEPYPNISSASALAQFNVCRICLNDWPTVDEESAFALCKSFSLADAAVRAEDVLAQINRDREASGFQRIAGPEDIEYLLDEIRRETAAGLLARLRNVPGIRLDQFLKKVAAAYKEVPSPLTEMLIDAYNVTVREETEKEADLIRHQVNAIAMPSPVTERRQAIRTLLSALTSWDKHTAPARAISVSKGIFDKGAKELYHTIRETAVMVHNAYQMTEESKTIMEALQTVFGDEPGVAAQLGEDLSILSRL